MIVGLGNPGREYKLSPHNAGFEVLDIIYSTLKEDSAIEHAEQTKQHNLCQATLHNKKILFVKPLLFMNNSGKSVKHLQKEYAIPADNIWVVQDELDLPLGTIRVSFNSRSAGNKGVQDIVDQLGTQKFHRFRVGVGAPTPQSKTTDTEQFLTSPIPEQEKEQFQSALQECANIVIQSIQQGSPIRK